MPVLGVPSAQSAISPGGPGLSAPGIWVPAGSLEKWRAARDGSASSLCEVAIFGDSTTYGSANGTPAFYSWIQKLRALSRAAGYADGGRGIAGVSDFATLTTGGPSGEDGTLSYSSLGGWAGAGGPMLTETFGSTTGGQALVLQGWGTKCRLHFGKTQSSGQFTVSIDGGSATTYESYTPKLVGGTSAYFSAQSILLDLTSYGLHTVTVTNVGGSVVNPPDLFQIGNGGAGTLNGTYFYAATCLTGAGETPIGATVSRTTAGAQAISFFIATNDLVSAQQWRIYRSTTGAAGSYRLLDTIASSITSYTDTGSLTPGATAPPSTNTAGLDTGRKQVQAVAEFINDTGIVYHRNAVSGTSMNSWFNKTNWNFNLQAYSAVLMGVTPDTALNNFAVDNAEAAHPPYRKVRLAISALGINNQQGTAADSTTLAANLNYIREGLHVFALMARNAGADPLVVIPHYDMATGGDYGGEFREATVATAKALHLPIVDFNTALGPKSLFASKGYVNNVHSNQAVYDAEATFLWNNVLSL